MKARHEIEGEEKESKEVYKWKTSVSHDGERLNLFCNSKVVFTADISDGECRVFVKDLSNLGWGYHENNE